MDVWFLKNGLIIQCYLPFLFIFGLLRPSVHLLNCASHAQFNWIVYESKQASSCCLWKNWTMSVTFSFLSEGNMCTRKQCTDQYLNNVCNNVKIISPLYTSLKNCFKGDQKLQSCWYNFWCQGSELLQFFWICKHSGGLISRQKEKKRKTLSHAKVVGTTSDVCSLNLYLIWPAFFCSSPQGAAYSEIGDLYLQTFSIFLQ